ncbi:MAG: hypothetical protein HFF02_02990 [Erysipelotrichaceae bacterium]|nr:hypothetical protein [Erysipelotrichaceae bacterium]
MINRYKDRIHRYLAVILALFMSIQLIASTYTVSYASQQDVFTITFTDGQKTVSADGAKMTITDKQDPNHKAVFKIENGVAEVLDFIEAEHPYILSVKDITGYENLDNFEIVANANQHNIDIIVKPIDKITISGKIVDENKQPYEGARIQYEGYVHGETTSNVEGMYSFQAYKGQDYKIIATTKDERYVELNKFVISPNENYRCDDFQLELKQNKMMLYADNDTDAYRIQFEVAQDGTITYTDATTSKGETIQVETDPNDADQFLISVTPKANMRVSSMIMDGGTLKNYQDNDKKITNEKIDKSQKHTFEMTFESNVWNVSATVKGKGGTVSVLTNQPVIHNESAELLIQPDRLMDDGYRLKTITISNSDQTTVLTSVELSADDQYEEKADGTSLYHVMNITKDTDIEIEFEPIPVLSESWTDIIDFADTKLVKQDDETYYFLHDATIAFTSKDTRFDQVSFKCKQDQAVQPWNEVIKQTCEIESFYVRKIKTGNEQKINLQTPLHMIIDHTKPEIDTKEELDWTKDEKVTITGTVQDSGDTASGAKYIVWKKDQPMSEQEVLEAIQNQEANVKEVNDKTFSFDSESKEQNATYYIYATDLAQNVSEPKTVKVKIDQTAPDVTFMKFSISDTVEDDDNIGFLDSGTFYNDTLYLKVSAQEDASSIASGIHSFVLYKDEQIFGEPKDAVNGTAIFELTQQDYQDGAEIKVVAIDAAQNQSVAKKPTECTDTNAKSNTVRISSASSFIEENIYMDDPFKDTEGRYWYQKEALFHIQTEDLISGVKSINVQVNGNTVDKDIDGNPIDKDNLDFEILLERNALEYGENTIVITVVSYTNQTTKLEKKFYVDDVKPVILNDPKSITFKVKPQAPLNPNLNSLPFGTFANDKVYMELHPTDGEGTVASGIKECVLYADDEELSRDASCTFVLPVEELVDEKMHFDKNISFEVVDHVGNVSDKITPNENNSNIKNSNLMIETKRPNIAIEYEKPNEGMNKQTAAQGDWYANDVIFHVDVEDRDSGIQSIQVFVNDQLMDAYCRTYDEEKIIEDTLSIDTAHEGIIMNEDGSYQLKIMVIDHAGNVSQQERIIYKDAQAPYIEKFDFETDGYLEGNHQPVERTEYGFYFKEDTMVVIYAKDDKPSAGVQSITYYMVDIEKGKSEIKTQMVDKDGKIKFVIPANFKGQIYAKTLDNVLNESLEVTPDSAIIETEEKHKETDHIAFDREKTTIQTRDGSDLYAKDIPVTITVTDDYSGIRDIEWSVKSPYDTKNNQSGKVIVNNDMTFTSESDTGWETKNQVNLISEMRKTILIQNNSNHIVLQVKMTDRAGNTSQEEITFSIDKTAPLIHVDYDNNEADTSYTNTYKGNRVATITVTERNFRPEDVIYDIKNTDGIVPKLSEWVEHKNLEDEDKTYYTATLTYSADGDYTFHIEYSDLAKNNAPQYRPQNFTIDKTKPVLSISYDNNNSVNGNYYPAARTATVTIVEHNFDSSRVRLLGSASDNGAPKTYPTLSGWNHQGDTHTATIHYDADGKYTFDIDYMDKAGNKIDDFKSEEFYVDQTAPTLEITGVADHSANNVKVAPVITYSDTNFDKNGVQIDLSGINKGKVNYAGTYADAANGQTFTYADFEKVQEVDDIYTLNVSLDDKAGNNTKKMISFSANRFGSVYDLTSVQSMIGKYLKEEKDIILVETNVDSLNHDDTEIKLTKNGNPSTLVEGKDYNVHMSGGNGQWSQYRYTIKKNLFEGDGRYSVSVHSIDASGNINENIDETKKAEISFGIDKTAPVVVPIDFESGKQYPVESKQVSVEIKDNLVLDHVQIFLNDEVVSYENTEDHYYFTIPQSNRKQTVTIAAQDAAGNIYEMRIEDFLVSTNIFARWYNNTPLFITSIVGCIVLGGGFIFFILMKKRKEEQDESIA